MTPEQIFMLGWQAHEKKLAMWHFLHSFGDFRSIPMLSPPTEAEIKQIITENETTSQASAESGDCPRSGQAVVYDKVLMKEHSIG